MSIHTLDRIHTARLVLERLGPEHAEEVLTLDLDPRIGKTLWSSPEPPSNAEVLDRLELKIDHWQRHGFGMWLLRDRATHAMVGRGGLQHTFVAGMHEVEVGWAIVPQRWGEGLATELALAALGVAFDDLGLLRVVAFTRPDNVASRRVMEKAGMRYSRDLIHAGLPHVLYSAARKTASQRTRSSRKPERVRRSSPKEENE